jgi:hypothetical protein
MLREARDERWNMSTQPNAAIAKREGTPRIDSLVALLAAALLLGPGLVRADIVLTATLPPLTPPLENAISRAEPSTLAVRVTNTGSQIVREVDITIPSQYNSVTNASAPDNVTWTTTMAGSVATFKSTTCSSAGIPPGDSAVFTISFHGNYTSNDGDNAASSAFTVDGTTSSGGTACDSSVATDSTTFTAPVKSLYIQGSLIWNNSNTATITWTVTNNNGAQNVSNVAINAVVDPRTGFTGGNCPNIASITARGGTGTSMCQYTFQAPGTYTFTATARNDNGTGNSSAAGDTVGPINYGSTPTVTWTKALVVTAGVTTNTLTFTVGAPSSANVTKVELLNTNTGTCAPASWTLSSANPSSATNGLVYQTSTSTDVVFSGTPGLGAGLSSDITVNWSAVPNPAAGTDCQFNVKVTYGSSTSLQPQVVRVLVPIGDIAQFTVRANDNGQVLEWANTTRADAPHDGVVIFREPFGTSPASPIQFKRYTVGQDRVVSFTSGGDWSTQFLDTSPGNYNYRVCNHDANFVYSSCSSGYTSGAGWVNSGAVVAGGWVHALALDARQARAGFVPGRSLAQATTANYVAILDVATGDRKFAPSPIPSIPTTYTPVAPLVSGKAVLFAADQGGNVTAIDIADGSPYWSGDGHVNFPGQNFTAGVAGITWAYGSQWFKSHYSVDILLLGSTTGNVYAIDTSNGNVLWTFSAGHGVYGLINYDSTTDVFYVPTLGGGVLAYDLTTSTPTKAPSLKTGWAYADAGGNYTYHCVRFLTNIACVNDTGALYVVDKLTGSSSKRVNNYNTNTTSPNAPVLDSYSGNSTKPGLVITTASGVKIFTIDTTKSPYSVAQLGSTWTPPRGVSLSTPVVFSDLARRYLVVGGSTGTTGRNSDCTTVAPITCGQRLYRISLNDATRVASSPRVSKQANSVTLAQPVYDSASDRYLFGTIDGHVWAVPSAGWSNP